MKSACTASAIRPLWVGCLFLIGSLATGCNTPLASRGLDNYDHGPDKPIESWTQTAGSEGRADKTMQKSNEPDWFRNLLTSQKARDIERNLGFE